MADTMRLVHASLAVFCGIGVAMGLEPVWIYWLGGVANVLVIPVCKEAYGD